MARLKAKICTIAGATSGIGERTAEVWVVNSISPGGIATGIFGKGVGPSAEQAEQKIEVLKGAFAGLQPRSRRAER